MACSPGTAGGLSNDNMSAEGISPHQTTRSKLLENREGGGGMEGCGGRLKGHRHAVPSNKDGVVKQRRLVCVCA